MTSVAATWTLATPPGPGAVAIVQLQGDIDAALQACGINPVAVGEVRLRDLMDIDRGLVARFTSDMGQIMPHGGVAVVRALLAELAKRGIAQLQSGDAGSHLYPEARSQVEARALAALSRAASPLAVDLLLAQHQLWSAPNPQSDPARDAVLNRLIDPPLVVALGPSNIGKSTLINTLAGRSVSIVADEPGTTRDHVGVMLDLAGLVVRYVDTPGLRERADAIEQEALASAMEVAAQADLLLVCGDAGSPPPQLPSVLAARDRIVVALRKDIAPASFAADAQVSAVTGDGIPALVELIKDRLVPAAARRSQQPWRFW